MSAILLNVVNPAFDVGQGERQWELAVLLLTPEECAQSLKLVLMQASGLGPVDQTLVGHPNFPLMVEWLLFKAGVGVNYQGEGHEEHLHVTWLMLVAKNQPWGKPLFKRFLELGPHIASSEWTCQDLQAPKFLPLQVYVEMAAFASDDEFYADEQVVALLSVANQRGLGIEALMNVR